jgi:hypothetical protein
MKKILVPVLISLLSASVMAGSAAPGAPAKIELTGQSSFKLDAKSRNPFWPIGWKPIAKFSGGDSGSGRTGDIPLSAFVVSSIAMDETGRFAIINGKTMKEGQEFGLRLGAATYTVTIKRIEDGRVILARHDQELAVPLRRR